MILKRSNSSTATTDLKQTATTKNGMATKDYYSKDVMDYCFFESEWERDFYDTPAPSEDIWKKFELLPTPPRSPRREAPGNETSEEHLQLVSDMLLEDPICRTFIHGDCDKDIASLKSFDLDTKDECHTVCGCHIEQSGLRLDTMWSDTTLLKGDTKKKDTKPTPSEAPTMDIESECVDPTAVFPYPIVSAPVPVTPVRTVSSASIMSDMSREHSYSMGTETPSDSEEEIDVVTVDKYTVCTKKKTSLQNGTTIVMLQPQNKQIVINKASSLPSMSLKRPYRSLSTPNSPGTPAKKLKREISVSLKSAIQKVKSHHHQYSRPPSLPNSDGESEDSEGKRAQHNVLERKRRNDLKYSFLSLRDHVPDLHSNERAPKVVILRKASDYIHRLEEQEQTLRHELEQQKAKKERLLQKVTSLRSYIH